MTVLFSETFSGSGDLHGKLPDIADPGGNAWVSTDVDDYERRIVLADGYAVSSATEPVDPADEEPSMGLAYLPLSGYAPLAEWTFSFDVLTGSSVSLGAAWRAPWSVSMEGMLDDGFVGLMASISGSLETGWMLELNTNGSNFADAEPSLLPETLYPCIIYFSAGSCTFSGFGQTLVLEGVGGIASTFSLTGISLYLGLNARLGGMSISDAATDPEIIAAAPSVLAAPAVLAAVDTALASFEGVIPMMTLQADGHDATGENSLQGVIPMMTLQADCGAVMAGRILMMTMDAAMTGVALISVELSIPVMTLDAAGKGSPYIVTADLRIPMMMLQSDGGAGASLALPMMTLGASMTSGGLLTADLRIPMMALDAGMTRQGTVWADLTISMMVPMASITADLSIPMMALDASITAVVTVNYEAYSINLSHAPGNPAPVDEVTRYTNFPFTHIVRYQGSYFGVAADGLYQLGGATDDGVAIPYALKTGTDDFDTPQLKTVAAAYFGGRLGPSATVTLHAGETGAESYSYTTPRGQAAQSHREKFGRGVKSRYFALGLAGEDALALDSIELEINKLKRRT